MSFTRRPSPQTIAVLEGLASAGSQWSHGYDLCRALGLKAGTVYPILVRLADRGHLETSWETDPPRGRPARHLYRLSALGAQYVEELVSQHARREGDHTMRGARPGLGHSRTAGAQV